MSADADLLAEQAQLSLKQVDKIDVLQVQLLAHQEMLRECRREVSQKVDALYERLLKIAGDMEFLATLINLT